MAAANPSMPAPFGSLPAARSRATASGAGLSYKWAVLLCLLPALTLVTLDLTIVNVALAKLAAVFGVDVATVGWVVTGFALALGVVTPMTPYVETRFTLKRTWVTAVTIFTVGSVLCGLAPAFWALVAGRALQGVGGGMLLPISVSALFSAFPAGERGGAMGLLAIPMIAGPAFGPTLGGYIVTHLDWRMIFFVNLPVGLLAVALAALLLRPSQPNTQARFDMIGAVLSSLAFGCILYGLSRVGADGWSALTVRILLGVGLLSLVTFCIYEVQRDDPLLDVRLFTIPQFLIANVVFWIGNIALMGTEFMMPLYLQQLRGLSALDTGLLLMPQGFAVALSGPIAGKLVDKVGARVVALFGFALLAFNTWELSHLTLDTSYTTLRWLLVVRGLSFGCAIAPPQLASLAVVPARLRTNASSLNKGLQSVFQGFGVGLLATLLQTQTVVHRAVLSWQVRPDTLPGAFLGQVSTLLQASAGLSAPAAEALAAAALLNQVARQASVLAFGDSYRVTFAVALLALLASLLLPGRGDFEVDQAELAGA